MSTYGETLLTVFLNILDMVDVPVKMFEGGKQKVKNHSVAYSNQY